MAKAKKVQPRFQFQMRFSEDEFSKIEDAARREGLPVGTWIRVKSLQVAQGDLVPRRAAA